MLRKCLHSTLLATFCILKIHIESINEEPGGGAGEVAHTSNPSTWEAGAGRSL